METSDNRGRGGGLRPALREIDNERFSLPRSVCCGLNVDSDTTGRLPQTPAEVSRLPQRISRPFLVAMRTKTRRK